MRALFVVDDLGRGHRVRCEALAQELRTRGWQTEMLGPTDTAPGWLSEVLIMDLRPERRPPSAPLRSVQIVDDASPVPPCQLLVCGGAGARAEMFRESGAERVLEGPQYALLRPEFGEVHRWLREKSDERVQIADLRELSGYPAAAALAADLHNYAAVAITYGGMRAMECACVGTPMVVIPRNPGEQLNADGLLAAGAAVIGSDYQAHLMAETLLKSPTLLQKMSRNGRDLVDGRGVKRVAAAIQEMCK